MTRQEIEHQTIDILSELDYPPDTATLPELISDVAWVVGVTSLCERLCKLADKEENNE